MFVSAFTPFSKTHTREQLEEIWLERKLKSLSLSLSCFTYLYLLSPSSLSNWWWCLALSSPKYFKEYKKKIHSVGSPRAGGCWVLGTYVYLYFYTYTQFFHESSNMWLVVYNEGWEKLFVSSFHKSLMGGKEDLICYYNRIMTLIILLERREAPEFTLKG